MLPKSMRSPHSWDGRGLMQLSWQHFAGGIGLVFAAMIAWFGALWLNLQGTNLWVFRLCMFLVLALAVGAIVWWLHNRQKAKPAGEMSSSAEGTPSAGVTEDILLILREAEARVASSTQLPRGTRLSSLPVIFLVGDSAAGKTCVATQSGLEPELLSGQVYQEGNIASTRLANLWFARKAVFVEMGGKTLGDANLWTRLLHRLAPGKLRSIFSGKPARSGRGLSRFPRLSELVFLSMFCLRAPTACLFSTIFSAT